MSFRIRDGWRDPDALVAEATSHGLEVELQRTDPLDSGKAFEVLWLRKDPH
jgi:hypothetical protein